MPVLQDILEWTHSIPAWQSDAVARLFTKQTLSQQDFEELYALLKAEHGIPDPKGRIAKKFSPDQIPALSSINMHVELLAVKNLRHVNCLAENQRLPFGAKGLTIIYGDNGSGKSGYSRVLKRACRARDQNETIHPNAHLPATQAGTPEAIFELVISGATKEVIWEHGKTSPPELSTLSIFDSRCARAYLDEEDDFTYVPYGLDILEGLARICKHLETLLKSEQAQNTPDTAMFSGLENSTTAVGKLVGSLSAKTKPEQVEVLATLSAAETVRREHLLQSLKSDNPKEKAKQLRLLSGRIERLAKNTKEKLSIVDEAAFEKINGLAKAYSTAKWTAELASKVFKEDKSILPGTGSDAWKKLFEAAKTFCLETYTEKEFPYLGQDALCPLCQQPLRDAANRLIQFEKFIQNATEKNAKDRKKDFDDANKIFKTQNLSLGLDYELFAELEDLEKELAFAVRDFENSIMARHTAIKEACESQFWGNIPPEPSSPQVKLQKVAKNLLQDAIDLEKAADENARSVMQAEFDQLDSRLKLAQVKAAVLAAIQKYNLQAKLTKCLSAVKTNSISMKATDLTEKVISKELADALNREFKALGAGNLRVALKSRSVKGKALHKLTLELSQMKPTRDILSEGEQRAIAIGSFLAEVNIGGGTGGIVFDDPVSSLDHKRRERVALRFVQEATKRQVIIFTHDIYFVSVLMDEAQRTGIDCFAQSLSKRPEGYGVADQNLPFESIGTKSRVGSLRNMQQQIAKFYKEGNEVEHKKHTIDAYRQLRITWERAVEEVLFRNVVLRFRKGVSTQLLSGVVVEDQDYSIIETSMAKCSNYAHDQALMGGTQIPDPDELLTDINALDNWRSQVEERSKHVQKKRKTELPLLA